MNLQEFKAWFEGFTEVMDAVPTRKQWERIQERVKQIKDAPTTRDVFIRHYWPPYYTWTPTYTPIVQHWSPTSYEVSCSDREAMAGIPTAVNHVDGQATYAWDASNAFRALGHADAHALN